jgi:hypothetical protein
LPEERTLIEVTSFSDLILKKAGHTGGLASSLHASSAAKRINMLACGAEDKRLL